MRASTGHARRGLLGALVCALLGAALLASPAAIAAAPLCERGGGPGQCEDPKGLAVDRETERLYLADEDNDRVDVFDTATEGFLFSFGSAQLDSPRSVAVDNDPGSSTHHDVFVADFGNRRVLHYEADGSFLGAIGEGDYEGSAGPERTDEMLIAVGPDLDAPVEADSELYVVDVRRTPWDPGGATIEEKCPLPAFAEGEAGLEAGKCLTTRLRRYAPGGGAAAFEADIAAVDRGSTGSGNLIGMAADSAGNVYVRNFRGGASLCKYDEEGTKIPGFREAGCFPAEEAEEVRSLYVDEADVLWAAAIDTPLSGSARVIAKYDPAGTILRRFGYNDLDGLVEGLAAAPGGEGPAYASVSDEVRAIPLGEGPEAVTRPPEDITTAQALLSAEVNPEGKATEFRFEYLTEAEYQEAGESFAGAASTPDTPLGAEDFRIAHRAEATVGCPDPEAEAGLPESPCLLADTEYRWRVVASDADEEETAVQGEPFKTGILQILDSWAAPVGVDSATLHLLANPFGAPSDAFFEYIAEADYLANLAAERPGFEGASKAPDVDGGEEPLALGAGLEAVSRATTATLEPDTAYRVRAVATNALLDPEEPFVFDEPFAIATLAGAAAVPCAAEGTRGGLPGARFGAGAFLPDCRAHELVSPVEKNNADIIYTIASASGLPLAHEQSSLDGARLAYSAKTGFAEPEGNPFVSQYVAERHAGEEWRSHSVSSPAEKGLLKAPFKFDVEFDLFSPDLCRGWLRTISDPPLAPGAPEGYLNLYRRSDELCGDKAHTPITTEAPEHVSGSGYALFLQGVSADGERAIYRANDRLGTIGPVQPSECKAGSSSPCLMRLYSHSAAEGTLYVCVLPGAAKEEAPSCAAGTSESIVAAQRQRNSQVENAISADGERIFWSSPAPGEGRIYVRENPYAPEESPRVNGAAAGTGDVIGPARGTGRILKNKFIATGVRLEDGGFVVDQEVEDSAEVLPAGTKIEALEVEKEEEAGGKAIPYYKLSFDQAATGNALTDTFTGLPSATVAGVAAASGAFEADQSIEGPGIPRGTTIESCAPECGAPATSLTLSQIPTSSGEGAPLRAFSPCVRPLAGACTTPVSSAAELAAQTGASRYRCAADDGSRAIFTTGGGLYEFHLEGELTHRVAGEVVGVAGCSQDATVVYLGTREALSGANVKEENSEKDKAIAGEINLYRYQAAEAPGGAGDYEFIATLAQADIVNSKISYGPLAAETSRRLSRVSPDGGALAFMSAAGPASLASEGVPAPTGADNTDAEHGEADMQAYLYRAGPSELSCASCNPTGARPLSVNLNPAAEKGPPWGAGWIPPWSNPLYAARALSDAGNRLFFESRDRLAARDTNGRIDVYQWEAPGTGTCSASSPAHSPRNEGCVELISTGRASSDADFRDASPSGEDVFFATAESILPTDYGLVDIYDARAGGGLPLPPTPAPACEGEACQSPPPAPLVPPVASSTYKGPGDVDPPLRCNSRARRAARFSRRAKGLRRALTRTRSVPAKRRKARRAKALAKRARAQSRAAKRCRARARAARRAAR